MECARLTQKPVCSRRPSSLCCFGTAACFANRPRGHDSKASPGFHGRGGMLKLTFGVPVRFVGQQLLTDMQTNGCKAAGKAEWSTPCRCAIYRPPPPSPIPPPSFAVPSRLVARCQELSRALRPECFSALKHGSLSSGCGRLRGLLGFPLPLPNCTYASRELSRPMDTLRCKAAAAIAVFLAEGALYITFDTPD